MKQVALTGILLFIVTMGPVFFIFARAEEGGKKTVLKEGGIAVVSSRNPFLTSQEEKIYKQLRGRILITEGMDLSAIFYFPRKSKAIINGRIVKEGDSVGGKKIVKIRKESVILKDVEGEYVLCLRNVRDEAGRGDGGR